MRDEDSPAHHWLPHDDVHADWTARRTLAASIRGLAERCVRSDSGEDALLRAAAAIDAVTASLDNGDTSFERFQDGRYGASPAEFLDRTALTGRCNPIAPPLRFTWDGTQSACPLTFTEVHQGASGMAHGGWIASALDQVCGHVMVMSHMRGFTGKLTVRYLKPTPLHQPLECVGWVEKVAGRSVTVFFELRHGPTVLVEGRGLMIQMDLAKAQQVIRNAPPPDDS